jgi:hypothetical protein
MFNMRDVLVEEERRQEMMRQAEYGRFVQQVTPTTKFKCLLCIRLGNMLVRFGHRLQARYAIQSSTGEIDPKIWLQSP